MAPPRVMLRRGCARSPMPVSNGLAGRSGSVLLDAASAASSWLPRPCRSCARNRVRVLQ